MTHCFFFTWIRIILVITHSTNLFYILFIHLQGMNSDLHTKIIWYFSVSQVPLIVKISLTNFSRHILFSINFLPKKLKTRNKMHETLSAAMLKNTEFVRTPNLKPIFERYSPIKQEKIYWKHQIRCAAVSKMYEIC